MTKIVHWGQIPGSREYQEDYAITRGGESAGTDCFLLVCDGMGGHAAGDVASKTAARAFLNVFNENKESDPKEWLPIALSSANAEIASAVSQNEALADMGTTLLACTVRNNSVFWISVGDSILYHVRNSVVTVLNDDHSMAPFLDKLAEEKQISKEEALRDPRRNALRSAVMGDEIPLVDLSEKPELLVAGDILILASDGILSLEESEIGELSSRFRKQGAEAVANALLESVESKNLSHQDNTTVAVYIDGNPERRGFLQKLLGT